MAVAMYQDFTHYLYNDLSGTIIEAFIIIYVCYSDLTNLHYLFISYSFVISKLSIIYCNKILRTFMGSIVICIMIIYHNYLYFSTIARLSEVNDCVICVLFIDVDYVSIIDLLQDSLNFVQASILGIYVDFSLFFRQAYNITKVNYLLSHRAIALCDTTSISLYFY